MIGKSSGAAGIAFWINENYGLKASEAVDKKDALVTSLKEWVDAEYAGGRQTTLSTHEIEEKIEELTAGRLRRL